MVDFADDETLLAIRRIAEAKRGSAELTVMMTLLGAQAAFNAATLEALTDNFTIRPNDVAALAKAQKEFLELILTLRRALHPSQPDAPDA